MLQEKQDKKDEDETRFQMRLEAIKAMPPGEQQSAIADLSRDYPNRMDLANSDLDRANTELSASLEMPGMRSGPAGNPYAVSVAANPLEFMAQGLRGYNAVQDRKAAKSELETLSQGRESGLGAVMGAGMPTNAASQDLSSLLRAPEAPSGTSFGGLGETEEEKLRRMMGL